jgi:hypothetical protein
MPALRVYFADLPPTKTEFPVCSVGIFGLQPPTTATSSAAFPELPPADNQLQRRAAAQSGKTIRDAIS